MKKRFMLMNCCVLLCIVIALVSVLAAGKSYTMPTMTFFPQAVKPLSVEITSESADVVEVTGYELSESGHLLIHLRSVAPGSASVIFEYRVLYPEDVVSTGRKSASFRVNRLGMITDRTFGINFSGYQVVILCILASLAIVILFTLWNAITLWRQGRFSYLMVASGGVAIFASALLLFSLYKFLNKVVYSFQDFITIVFNIGTELLLGLSPIMLVMAVVLAFSNLWLIRHEGFRPINLLGILFAFVWFVTTAFMFGYNLIPTPIEVSSTMRYALLYICCYFECLFISTAACTFLASRWKPPFDKDYIIILGCGIRKDGTLTPLLRARADSALAFEQRQYETTGKHAVFVPSGGQGPDECISEAEAMERYLLEQGIPAERIIKEDKSVNTMQNMAFSKTVIEANGGLSGKKIAFATTNYHVFRGYVLSRKCGFEAQGISAKTKMYFYLNAYLREFVGLIVDQKYRILASVAMTVTFFLLLHLL